MALRFVIEVRAGVLLGHQDEAALHVNSFQYSPRVEAVQLSFHYPIPHVLSRITRRSF